MPRLRSFSRTYGGVQGDPGIVVINRMISRPPQITDRHLRRRAAVYIRQSSFEQVRANFGSAEVQRDLAPKLEAWGWAPSMIDTLEGDLGISGARAGVRDEFNRLLDRMTAGEIGLVAVVDISRLSRNIVDLFQFIDRAQRHDVLLAQGDQIIDFSDPNSFFLGGIFGLNAIRDNRARAQLSVQARWKKAKAGLAPTAPPVGYVRRPDGTWGKDPDGRVRDTITVILDKALEIGSIRGTLRYLRTHKIQVPRRRWRAACPGAQAGLARPRAPLRGAHGSAARLGVDRVRARAVREQAGGREKPSSEPRVRAAPLFVPAHQRPAWVGATKPQSSASSDAALHGAILGCPSLQPGPL